MAPDLNQHRGGGKEAPSPPMSFCAVRGTWPAAYLVQNRWPHFCRIIIIINLSSQTCPPLSILIWTISNRGIFRQIRSALPSSLPSFLSSLIANSAYEIDGGVRSRRRRRRRGRHVALVRRIKDRDGEVCLEKELLVTVPVWQARNFGTKYSYFTIMIWIRK